MNFIEAVGDWKSNDEWRYADKEAAWKFFFAAGKESSQAVISAQCVKMSQYESIIFELRKQLQAKVAELEEENARLNRTNSSYANLTKAQESQLTNLRQRLYQLNGADSAIDSERQANCELTEQLAASQLSNQQLREALEKTRGALAYVKGNGRDNPNLMESTAWHGLALADKALAQPTSTEALDAYVAEKVKEATLPVADELQAGRLQWMVRETAAEEKVTTLTRQRDLAVDALEWIASSLPQIGVERVWMLDHAIKTLLAAIKESEK